MNGYSNPDTRLETAIAECDFMRKWPGYSTKAMRNDIDAIFELASNPDAIDFRDDHRRGLELLLVLEAKRAYDERLAGLFCDDWFDLDSPADLVKMLTAPNQPIPQTLLWNLMSRVCGNEIELIDARQMSEEIAIRRFATCSPSSSPSAGLVWILLGRQPTPLFYIPDDD
ncbi:unnamed protein product [Caenorhabditis bovis]|uniref:Uncharacterized protein n=1 Tax=Caenorhabditis bovis TaxID=2654633 RepID=A0A8S1EFL6_9PELO|nr:unnamed protein product [Caenorhabditis bovis]